MPVVGITIHHSVCPSINGKGYDYYIGEDGRIIPASDQTDPNFIHVCLEGDFSSPPSNAEARTEQLFVFQKLVVRLADRYGFRPGDLFPHTSQCPGDRFPWSELVISETDRYH